MCGAHFLNQRVTGTVTCSQERAMTFCSIFCGPLPKSGRLQRQARDASSPHIVCAPSPLLASDESSPRQTTWRHMTMHQMHDHAFGTDDVHVRFDLAATLDWASSLRASQWLSLLWPFIEVFVTNPSPACIARVKAYNAVGCKLDWPTNH